MKKQLVIIKLKAEGVPRVLDGTEGMTFIVDKFTQRFKSELLIAHVRDYRYPGTHYPYQIWSIGPEGYEIVEE